MLILLNYWVKKLFVIAIETYFDEKVLGNKSTRDKSSIRILQSPSKTIYVSGVSMSTRCISCNYNKPCGRFKLFLQEKQAGIFLNIFNEEIVAIADNLLEYKSISTKQHKFLLLNCLN